MKKLIALLVAATFSFQALASSLSNVDSTNYDNYNDFYNEVVVASQNEIIAEFWDTHKRLQWNRNMLEIYKNNNKILIKGLIEKSKEVKSLKSDIAELESQLATLATHIGGEEITVDTIDAFVDEKIAEYLDTNVVDLNETIGVANIGDSNITPFTSLTTYFTIDEKSDGTFFWEVNGITYNSANYKNTIFVNKISPFHVDLETNVKQHNFIYIDKHGSLVKSNTLDTFGFQGSKGDILKAGNDYMIVTNKGLKVVEGFNISFDTPTVSDKFSTATEAIQNAFSSKVKNISIGVTQNNQAAIGITLNGGYEFYQGFDIFDLITDVANAAYEEGYADGYADGYEDGYNDGFNDGYDQGFADGVSGNGYSK